MERQSRELERQLDEVEWHRCQLDYLNAVLAEGDTAALMTALAAVACAQGRSVVAENAGLGRLGLCKIVSGNGNVNFATVVGVAGALGYAFSMRKLEPSDDSAESSLRLESRLEDVGGRLL